ncbi:GtrA family protein [bacterium 1XD42-94]|nr:GtrA family protein [bacterium 1XD42-76]NBK06640.1 GtrA family protein [bacterium 1XD42-94]
MDNLRNKIKDKVLNPEILLYAIFGVLTAIIGIVIYQGLMWFGLDYKISNLLSLVLGKLFAYVTNKKIVFRCKQDSLFEEVIEFVRFVAARSLTGGVDYFGVIVAVEFLHMDKGISKYVLQIIVIALNYVFGKKLVFDKEHCNPRNREENHT